ncbi:MAG: F0F1 ATP synthase subunit A [Myxococcales bacterium]|nr:F0F1 ATP synthase subunit A [Myxococcales bacterium]MCB9641576.1 F0F1 ATP synthase subunit A [Myxococcales bacterium]
MNTTPDVLVLWQWGPITLNATLLWTWLVMALLVTVAWWLGRNLSSGVQISRGQAFLESLLVLLLRQIEDVSQQKPRPFLPFVGTLFLFVATSNLLSIIPGYIPPTASLSTTTALALCVFVAVPMYGIQRQGVAQYFRQYLRPSVFMLPFNIIGEFSRTLALAVRLFGNVMSGRMIIGSLLVVVPFFFPIIMDLFGLLTGMIQAYIFAVLAMVYIASATQAQPPSPPSPPTSPTT